MPVAFSQDPRHFSCRNEFFLPLLRQLAIHLKEFGAFAANTDARESGQLLEGLLPHQAHTRSQKMYANHHAFPLSGLCQGKDIFQMTIGDNEDTQGFHAARKLNGFIDGYHQQIILSCAMTS